MVWLTCRTATAILASIEITFYVITSTFILFHLATLVYIWHTGILDSPVPDLDLLMDLKEIFPDFPEFKNESDVAKVLPFSCASDVFVVLGLGICLWNSIKLLTSTDKKTDPKIALRDARVYFYFTVYTEIVLTALMLAVHEDLNIIFVFLVTLRIFCTIAAYKFIGKLELGQ